jgi:thioredoxin reductase
MIDVLIAGGGPAGFSAALILGRCRRTVLLCDDGRQRNRSSSAIHGLPGHDGDDPRAFAQRSRLQLDHYETVHQQATTIDRISREAGGFTFACSNGTRGSAQKVLLATGLTDELPSIPGIEQFYGTSVHHCLYCDGYEYAGKTVVALGKGDRGVDLAIMMKHWIRDVVYCADDHPLDDVSAHKLAQFDIRVRIESIRGLVGTKGRLERLCFRDGADLACTAIFFSTGCSQTSNLAEQLGCERDAKGGLLAMPLTEETTQTGVYAAGDVSRDVLLVSIAIAEGAKAAVAINKAFLREEGLCQ